jgi:hypothetical protein
MDSGLKEDLIAKIEEARVRLGSEKVDLVHEVVGTRRIRISRREYREEPISKLVGREMAIAILTADGEIRIARGIKRDNKGLDEVTQGFKLFVRKDNGINSDIACIEPEGGKVIAVKYPVKNENNRFGGGDGVIQAIYTPFSQEIRTPEVIHTGLKFATSIIDRAYKQLESRSVMSQAFTGRKIVDVVPKEVVKILLINEHIDPSLFTAQAQAKPLIEQVLVVTGTNRERAYTYSISPAGARGFVQMIPSTYAILLRKYPTAGLNYDFNSGMVDLVNAIVAQVLLCDADWQTINSRKEVPRDQIGPFLAAAYNGGVGRVLNMLSDNEVEWMENPDSGNRPTKTVARSVPVSTSRTVYVKVRGKRVRKTVYRTVYVKKYFTYAIFRAETNKYIQQYHWIKNTLKDE